MEEIKLSIKIGTFPRLKNMKLSIGWGIIWDHLIWRKYSTKAHTYKSSKKESKCYKLLKSKNRSKEKILHNFERKLFIYQYYMTTETTN